MRTTRSTWVHGGCLVRRPGLWFRVGVPQACSPEGAYPLAPVPAFAVVQFLERTVGLPGLSRRTVLLTDSPVGSAVSLGATQGVRGLWVSVSTVGPLTGVLDGLASGAAW